MNTHDIELPPLTTINVMGKERPQIWFTASEVDVLRRAAIDADRKRRGEPVAWRYLTPTGWHATTDAARALGVAEHHTVEPLFAAPQPDEPSKGETVLYTSQKALDLISRSDAVISVGLTRVPQMSWNVPLYTAPQPAEPVTPRTHFEDARVQKVYEIICGDNHPPYGEHWDGYVSRLIVDALFPAEPADVDHGETPVNIGLEAETGSDLGGVVDHGEADPGGYVHTAPDDCETLHWRGQILSLNELATISAEPVKVPSDAISVVGVPEFDALMDHIYENGTASEGVLPLANAFARALLARYGKGTP